MVITPNQLQRSYIVNACTRERDRQKQMAARETLEIGCFSYGNSMPYAFALSIIITDAASAFFFLT